MNIFFLNNDGDRILFRNDVQHISPDRYDYLLHVYADRYQCSHFYDEARQIESVMACCASDDQWKNFVDLFHISDEKKLTILRNMALSK